MKECLYCKAKTDRFDDGVAICRRCIEHTLLRRRAREILTRDLADASARSESAREAFLAITEVSSGLPYPDGVQSIHAASRAVTIARMNLLRAHHRLNDFLNTGIIPDDLTENE